MTALWEGAVLILSLFLTAAAIQITATAVLNAHSAAQSPPSVSYGRQISI